MNSYVEHANIAVIDPKKTVSFLMAALPEWKIRGQGEYQDTSGNQVEWFHVGTDDSYLALASNGKGDAPDWKTNYTGVKHVGIAVPDLDSLENRLRDVGYVLDHRGADHPYRKNAYYMEDHNLQFEFIEYLSQRPYEKNDYSL